MDDERPAARLLLPRGVPFSFLLRLWRGRVAGAPGGSPFIVGEGARMGIWYGAAGSTARDAGAGAPHAVVPVRKGYEPLFFEVLESVGCSALALAASLDDAF